MNVSRPARPDIHPDTLGLDAVMEVADQTWYASQPPLSVWDRAQAILRQDDHPAVALTERQQTRHTQKVRERIAGFDVLNRTRLSVFANTIDPECNEERRDLGLAADRDWIDWLTGDTPPANQRLFSILTEHVRRAEDIQREPEFTSEVGRQKERSKSAIKTGLAEGWLGEPAEAAVDVVDVVPVYAIDYYYEDYNNNPATLGHCDDRGFISLRTVPAYMLVNTSPEITELVQNTSYVPHELGHAVIGELGLKAQQRIMRTRAEEEAGAVQFADVTAGSSPDTIEMNFVNGYRTIYPEYMEAHQILLDGISARLLLRAYSGDAADNRKFDGLIDGRWGIADMRHELYGAALKYGRAECEQRPEIDITERAKHTGRFMTNVLKLVAAEPQIGRHKALRRIIRQSQAAMLDLKD